MVLLASLLLTTRRSNRFSTCGVGVTAFHVARGGKRPTNHGHLPTSTEKVIRNARHLVTALSASPDEGRYQQRPRKYLTPEDLAGNKDDNGDESLYPQRVYKTLSDFEVDVESMAANYAPGPEDFLDDLDGEDVYGLPSPPLKSTSQPLSKVKTNTLERSVHGPVTEPPSPKGSPNNLDIRTSTSQLNAGVQQSKQSPSAKRKATTTSTTTTYFTAKTASNSRAAEISKGPITDTSMADIAEPVSNNHDEYEYSSESLSSPAESISQGATFEAEVTSDTAMTTAGDDWSTLSREEFRSKFSFEEQALLPLKTTTTPTPPPAESSRLQDELGVLKETINSLEKQITTANNGSPINLSSYKQVSQALFGTPDESTSKDVLEAMAISNILAKLILEHRQTLKRYNKLKKKEESYKNQRIMTTTSSKSHTASTEPLLLVDTSSLIFRAYYSMPPMHRADGMPVSAVLGFCNLLNKMVLNPLLEGKQPRLVLCCDAPTPASGGPKTWRHDLYLPYKANRQEAPMDLVPQFPYFRLAAQAYGMTWIEAPGYEADDVIASLAHKALQEGLTTHIYSSDKDLMQLITNSSTMDQSTGKIEMVEPSTMTLWTHDSVVEKWGVPAHQLGDVLALAGDTADNIPGVPGIGPKIAAQLLHQFGSLEELLSNLQLVPQAKRREKLEVYRDQALLSQQLVQLERNLDWDQMSIDFPDPAEPLDSLPDRVADLRMQAMKPERILRFYEQMGFVTIKERLIEQLQKRSKWQDAYAEAIGSTAKRRPSKWQSKDKVDVPKPEDFDNVPF